MSFGPSGSVSVLKYQTRMVKPKDSCNYFHNILTYRVTGKDSPVQNVEFQAKTTGHDYIRNGSTLAITHQVMKP